MAEDTATLIPKRSIGTIVANVTISEQHNDDLVITEHPVEQGAAITDHAYKQPAIVVIRAAWSNSDPASGDDPNYVNRVYADLLALQESRILFDVYTGKRAYNNMLLRGISVQTDRRTESSLVATLFCRQLVVVESVSVIVSTNPEVQEFPEETQPTIPSGQKQPVAAPAEAINQEVGQWASF